MKIGALIKYHRTKHGMTQNELAAGICSIPHLSKIENNSKEANAETMRLLLERLQIELYDVLQSEQKIQSLLKELQQSIDFIENDKADDTMQKLQEIEELITFTDHLYLYELYKLRFYIFTNNLDLIEAQYNWLATNRKNFSQYDNYLLTYLNGLISLVRGKYDRADEILDQLVKEDVKVEPFEGELYYHFAMIKSSKEDTSLAILYNRKALEIYQNQYNFKRIVLVLMALGTSYVQGKVYKEAIQVYEHVLRNVKLLHQEELLPSVYHNLGRLYMELDESYKAIDYLEKSLNLIKKEHSYYLYILYNLAMLQYELHLLNECKANLLKLKRSAGANNLFSQLADYYLSLMESNEATALFILENKIFPQLKKSKTYVKLFRHYSNILKDYYLNTSNYEKAMEFMEKEQML